MFPKGQPISPNSHRKPFKGLLPHMHVCHEYSLLFTGEKKYHWIKVGRLQTERGGFQVGKISTTI